MKRNRKTKDTSRTMKLNPTFLEKNGRAEFVVLPVEEFQRLREYVEDLEDLVDLQKAIESEGDAATVSIDEVERGLGTA